MLPIPIRLPRHSRAVGGQNTNGFPPNFFPQLSAGQVASAIPQSAMTPPRSNPNPSANVPPSVNGAMPLRPQTPPTPSNRVNSQPLPQHKPPVPQFNRNVATNMGALQSDMPQFGGYYAGGRLKRATGGQNFSQYVANVPVGGSTGAVNSPYVGSPALNGPSVAQIGNNGIPVGSTAGTSTQQVPSFIGAQSDVPNPNAPPAASAAASTAAPTPISPSETLGQIYGGAGNIPGTFYGETNTSPSNPAILAQMTYGQFSNLDPNQAGQVQSYVNGLASGGKIPQFRRGRAVGGPPPSSEMAPWFTRREASDQIHTSGLFGGASAGRADTLNRSVPVDSHVIPSDVVASIGKGNTLAGGNVLTGAFHSLPYGVPSSGGRGTPALRLPTPPRIEPQQGLSMPRLGDSTGGRKTDHGASTVPIAASSGEFLVHPAGVYQKGLEAAKSMKLDPRELTPRKVMDLGHDVIDAFIVHHRKHEIKTLSRLPPPARD